MTMTLLRLATLVLFLLYPVAWVVPLMRAGMLPLFGLSEISVASGLVALMDSDPLLALLVGLCAIVAPWAKLAGLAAVQWGRAPARLIGPLHLLGRLAMADIFLVALYIVVVKGTGLGHVETAWGLWLFTFCTLASLLLTRLADARRGHR